MEGALPRLRTRPSSSSKQEEEEATTTTPSTASVIFDVDKGQTLQDLWPLACLSEEEQSAVAFHAFPDSLSMELYTRNAVKDSSFTFRIKRDPASHSSAGVPEFLYGYVFCRQRQDETLRRGGEQVAVVVLSTAPFNGALQPLSQAAGHAFFNEGPLALAMVYNQVLSWPLPVPGTSMCLPIGAAVINARMPYFCLMPPPQPAVDPGVQAALSRRASRALSLKASGSPRMAAVAAAAAAAAAAEGTGTGSPRQTEVDASQLRQPAAETLPLGVPPANTAEGTEGAAAAEPSPHDPKSDADAPTAPAPAAASTAADGARSAAAAASDDSSWAMVTEDEPQQQQQQQQQRGLSSGGSFSSLLGLSFSGSRPGSVSRLNRSAGSSSTAGRVSDSNSSTGGNQPAAAADGSSSNGAAGGSTNSMSSSSVGNEWLVTTLGQQWRDEKPFPEVEPALVLAPLLRDLWTLWQLVVTAQPLMVVGLTPGETSAATAALVSLVAPLPYAADLRPFFTIHDPDFVAMAAGQLPKRQRYHEVLPVQQQPQEQQQEQQQQEEPLQQLERSSSSQRALEPPPSASSPHPTKGQQLGSSDIDGDGVLDQQQQQQPTQQDEQQQQQQLPPLQQQQHRQGAASADKSWNLPALIGITNLYFVKVLPQWPNVVAVSRKEMLAPPPASHAGRAGGSNSNSPASASVLAGGDSASSAAPTERGLSAGGAPTPSAAAVAGANGPAASPPLPPAGGRAGPGFFSSTAAAAMRALQRRHQGPQHLLSHFAPHLWTSGKHVQCVKPDHALLSKARAAIEPAVGSTGGVPPAAGSSGGSCGVIGPSSPAGTAAARIRRHFAELTAALLAPFEVYFTPGPSGKVPAWRPDAFLANLTPAALPPVLSARLSGNSATAAAALYAAFIDSPNFAFWFQQRRAPVLHLVEDEPESDEEGFAEVVPGGGDSSDAGVESEPDEVELVQQLLSMEQTLMDWQQQQQEQQDEPASNAQLQLQQEQEQVGLQFQFVQVFRQLPKDVQAALFSNPPRQELLLDAAGALAGGSCAEQEAAAAVLKKLQELKLRACGEADAQHVV